MEEDGPLLELRVRYSETDQMGIAYHANYLVWCEMARTELLRRKGARYRSLEEGGLRLAVTDARVRYRQPALYDDLLKLDCWVRGLTRRSIEFGYLIEREADGKRLATATTTLVALDLNNRLSQIPEEVREKFTVVSDPVRM